MKFTRLSASALLLLAANGYAQQAQEEKPTEQASENAQAQPEQKELETQIVDVRSLKFMTPEELEKRLGKDWKKNEAVIRHLPADVAIRVNMTKSRDIQLKFDKEFALVANVRNSKGHGAISITDKWVKAGEDVTFKALPDTNAVFKNWAGDVKGATIKGDQITVKMDRPRKIFAVYASHKVDLKIKSEFGKPTGVGTFDRGVQRKWSVNSPVNISAEERAVAEKTSGVITLDDDKQLTLVWNREFKVAGLVNDAALGSVDGPSGWFAKGVVANFVAQPADAGSEFVKWEGVDIKLEKQNPLNINVSGSMSPKAIFARKAFNLTFKSTRGEVNGAGLHKRGTQAEWSLVSPVTETVDGVRFRALNPNGSVAMNSDKKIIIKWVEEVAVEVYKRTATEGEVLLKTVWIKKGASESISADAAGEYVWVGDVDPRLAHDRNLIVLANKPLRVTADYTLEKNQLALSSNAGLIDGTGKYFSHENADLDIPRVVSTKSGERGILDIEHLKKQLSESDSLTVADFKNTVEAKSDTKIEQVKFAGWNKCIALSNDKLKVIISTEVARVVYLGAPDGSENLLWLNEDYKGEKFSRSQAEEMWHDVGAVRAGVSPEELALPLIKRPFPQAYEFDGAPLKNVIINNGKVVIQSFKNAAYACYIERVIELNENRVKMTTNLVGTADGAHPYVMGPVSYTQFVRPDLVRFGKSKDLITHKKGYVHIKGTLPKFEKSAKEAVRETLGFDVPAENAKEWSVGTRSDYLQVEFKNYVLTAQTPLIEGEEFPKNNANIRLYSPESPVDFLEVSLLGSHGQLKKGGKLSSTVTWTVEKRKN